jgi:hypothetical protein
MKRKQQQNEIYCIIDRNDPAHNMFIVSTPDQIKEWWWNRLFNNESDEYLLLTLDDVLETIENHNDAEKLEKECVNKVLGNKKQKRQIVKQIKEKFKKFVK